MKSAKKAAGVSPSKPFHQESLIDALILLNDLTSFPRDGEQLVHTAHPWQTLVRKEPRNVFLPCAGSWVASPRISPYLADTRSARQYYRCLKNRSGYHHQRATQNRLVELQSELAHAPMGQLAAAISHELKQSLAAVDNYLSGLVRLLPTN